MKCLLDTHFVLWILSKAGRLKAYSWLRDYEPWGVSPVSLLEMQLLAEVGRGRVNGPALTKALRADPRFILDDVSLVSLIEKSLDLTWTRDPFDRLIAGHSLARRVPLCSVDQTILEHHKLLVHELHR